MKTTLTLLLMAVLALTATANIIFYDDDGKTTLEVDENSIKWDNKGGAQRRDAYPEPEPEPEPNNDRRTVIFYGDDGETTAHVDEREVKWA